MSTTAAPSAPPSTVAPRARRKAVPKTETPERPPTPTPGPIVADGFEDKLGPIPDAPAQGVRLRVPASQAFPSTALTISQAAQELGIDQRTLRQWADTGFAPHILLPSGYRRFTQDHIERIRQKINRPEGAAPTANVSG